MATTLKVINELFDETISDITSNSNSWQSFLKCASMNYKYDFNEQLLIYAQKPNAVACADYDTWNDTFKRYVKGAGIALLTEEDGYSRLRYVWDVSNTHSKYGVRGKRVKLWTINKMYETQVIESLENKYGEIENKDNLFDVLTSVADYLTIDNYIDYYNDLIENKSYTNLEFISDEIIENKYKELLKNSVAFMLMNRCGINPETHFIDDDFNDISMFNDIGSITRLGVAISDISEMGLREIYATLKNIRISEIEKIRTFDKNKNIIYDNSEKERSNDYEHYISKSRGLSTTESNSEREEIEKSREILNDEITISKREQESSIPNYVDERHISGTSGGNRDDSTRKNINDNEKITNRVEHQRRTESNQSNGMGRDDEQHQEISRGSSNERTNLQLKSKENIGNDILFSNDDKSNTSQLSLFASREQELADRFLDLFNSFDTKWKDTFYIQKVELKRWEHIKSKKRNLTIIISSEKSEGFSENSFTQFNKDKTDEIKLREQLNDSGLFKYLSKDKDFDIKITPDSLYIFYSKFDDKEFDLSVVQNETLSSINNDVNEVIIDNPNTKENHVIQKKERKNVLNYVLHPEVPYDQRINFKIENDDLGVGTPKERFNNNINAIKTLLLCESEDRYATEEEQEILSKYVGWGGLSQAFDENNLSWSSEYKELKNLLSEEEYNQAMETTLTAFYTPPTVIRAMYKALSNMGLDKGNILEPSCGIGNFIGMMPNNDKLKIYGVEVDSISGRIARQLYQKSSISISGFEETNHPDSFFDVAVGNVPFGEISLHDKKYDKYNFLIHDYFFAKSLDKVRPGGVVAFITSKGTLDKENNKFRKYLAQRADLIGAIRLPNDTFKKSAGTTVTSDIIFLQKRESITDIEPSWVNVGVNDAGITMNNYFIEHPEMILGKMEMISTQYGIKPECLPYEDNNLNELLDNAITNIKAEIKEYEITDIGEGEDLSIEADINVRNFSYTVVDDKVYYRENSRMYLQELALTTENRVKGLIELRDCLRTLINYQLEDYQEQEIKEQQNKLNDLYDKFSKKYGLINSRGNSTAFSNDSSYFLLCSLEILNENGELKRKADIFTKRTIKPHVVVENVSSAYDALMISLSEKAYIDLNFMHEISGFHTDKIIKDLEGIIFRVPEYGNPNHWVTSDEYLSGNVREKLKIAEQFAKDNSEFEINVKHLKEVIPKDIPTSEISVRLGATWIPEKIYQDFKNELLNSSSFGRQNTLIHYSELNGEWYIEGKNIDRNNIKVISTYGTQRANAYRLLEDALNLRDTRIFDYFLDETGKKQAILNKKETAIAQAKQDQIRQAFDEWIWKEPVRREELTKLYNETFNSVRAREYDGSHIRFDGMNPEIKLRKHQVNAIARILYGGNTLLAHEVGAGKTFEMVAAAMESKRLGLCNKSLFVVPNHIIEQFASEFLQLYPSANILVSTKKDFEKANRKKFCSRISTGDYDAIIIGHSQFEKIPMSVARQQKILQKQMDDIINGIMELKKNGGEPFSIKQMMKSKKIIEKKLIKLNDQSKKDEVVTFEELGVDRIFIDEAHYYKNLYLHTKMRNVGGIAQTEAQKSSDLFMKCRYLDELTKGKGIIFATGTPISNSMVELYTLQRYLQYDTLLKNKLQHFDSWASTFGETVTAIELAPEGTGYRSKTRFAKFYNLPELMTIFKEVADIQTSDTLNLPVPKAHYNNVVVKPTELQLELVKGLSERAERIRKREVPPYIDNMLKITNDGRKLALDQRVVDSNLPDEENSKIDICSQNIYKIWDENKDKKSAQLIFCDISTPTNDGTFNAYDDLKKKLINRGIPEEEIEFIHNANSEAKKKELFAKVRQGKVRVLLGSTQKMGAGTNCQDKLIALHDLDCPWRPSDLTQRSGRIIRQGNQNDDVYIYRYVTEKTFDAYLYQLVENKQKFISQVMTSKTPMRTAEDIDEVALSYAEIKALAAGNPLILEKTELDSQVSKLKLLKQSYLNQVYDLEDKVRKFYPSEIKMLENLIENYEKEIDTVNQNTPISKEIFMPMTINGIEYKDKQEAGKELLNVITTDIKTKPTYIGEYRGFKLEKWYDALFHQNKLDIVNNLTHTIDMGDSPSGNIIRIDNLLNSFEDKLKYNKEELDNTKIQWENAKNESVKPFAHEKELKEKTERLDELNILLNLNEKTHEIIDDGIDNEPEVETNRDDFER